MIERIGKAIRVPPRDAMLSYATHHMGRGWGFGLHEALDQLGGYPWPTYYCRGSIFSRWIQHCLWLVAHPGSMCSGCTYHRALFLSSPPRSGIQRDKIAGSGFFQGVLAVCGRGGSHCSRLCRLSLDRLPLPEGIRCKRNLNPDFICGCNGSGCAGCISFWSFISPFVRVMSSLPHRLGYTRLKRLSVKGR